ncbi:MAG TPA: nitrilase-related carbon-nitrogen hydrolase [Acidimicrobiales bacterium]|nr:nitrilase-related carbon-nitrogen hydrolase [Acidimicrobiales bacterium]
MSLRIAVLQLDYPDGETKRERVTRVSRLVADGPKADLVVLPELWDVGYFAFDDYATEAEPLVLGPAAALGLVAKERGCVVVGGSVLERDGDDLFNTTVVLGPDGDVLGSYRKMHLFAYGSSEGQLLTAGSEPVIVTTPVGRLGLSTCFDLRFPEQFADMRADGADVMVVPAAWPSARTEHWRVLVQARAIETQTPVIAVNGVGPCHGIELAGASQIVSARGSVILDAASAPGWHVGVVDTADTGAWREEFPMREATRVG